MKNQKHEGKEKNSTSKYFLILFFCANFYCNQSHFDHHYLCVLLPNLFLHLYLKLYKKVGKKES